MGPQGVGDASESFPERGFQLDPLVTRDEIERLDALGIHERTDLIHDLESGGPKTLPVVIK